MKTKEQILQEIDDKIDHWRKQEHQKDNIPLHEYLGWTWHQYSKFAQDEEIPNFYWLKNEIEKPEPRIVCAAMLMHDGYILSGTRHFSPDMRETCIRIYRECKSELVKEQGFIDQFGEFYTREEAWKVAEKQNQIRESVGNDGYLYSENLY